MALDLDNGHKLVIRVAREFAKDVSLDPVSAKALVDTVAYETSKEKFLFFIQKYPDVIFKFICECVRRLEEAYAIINGLGTKSLEQRVAVILLKLAESIGKKEESKIILDFSLSQQDLAEMAGRTLESVCRVMANLEREGVIESLSRKIVINDLDQLRLIVEKKKE